jgi:hypothetical protein
MTKDSQALAWCEEKHVQTELVLKPREICREVTTCTMKPVKSVDPATGCEVIHMEPVTETAKVKEIVFDTVTEEKTFIVRRPYLKPIEEKYAVKTLCLERSTVEGTRRERYGILVPTTIIDRVVPCEPEPTLVKPEGTRK